MNHRIVAKYMGYIMLVEGLFMIPSVFVSLWFGEPDTIKAFVPAIAVPLIGGLLLSRMKTAENLLPRRKAIRSGSTK